MKKNLFVLLFAFTLLTALSVACNFSVSTANITAAQMAKDAEGNQPTTVFNQDEAIYALVSLKNAPADTAVKAVWTAVEADGTEPNLVLSEKTITSGDGSIHFSLTNSNLWPVGKYKVDLYLNDKLNRTLEFTVEGKAAVQAPTATPIPTTAPTAAPVPTATPAPTQTATTEATVEATQAVEPLPLQAQPYTHPSGAFTFVVPQGWKLQNEDETSANFSDGQTYVGAVFSDGQIVYGAKDMQNYIDKFIEQYFSFAKDYQIDVQKTQPDDSIYVSLTYNAKDGRTGTTDFFFEQHNTIVFVLVFDTPVYDQLHPTWDEIVASYSVDPKAALAAIPAATPTAVAAAPKPVSSTPTPKPVKTNPFAPQAGQSRLYVFNEFNQELTFTINSKEHKIPTAGIDHPTPIDLAPGRYTFTVSIPGGSANGEVTMAADQSWSVGVRGDGAVYNPFQVYP